MNASTEICFIEKTIDKTKQKILSWSVFPEDFQIKPLPNENTPNTNILIESHSLSCKDSYVANYQTGQLLLIVRVPRLLGYPVTPPDRCILSLRIQDHQSRFSIEIANSETSNEIATALIRLYNLIDKDVSSLNRLINNFLNS